MQKEHPPERAQYRCPGPRPVGAFASPGRAAMSIQDVDSRLDLDDLPDVVYERRYQKSLGMHHERGDARRGAAPEPEQEMDNPHDMMNMEEVRIEMTAFMAYDTTKRCYSLRLEAGDMQDFLSLSNPGNTQYDLSRAVLRKATVNALDGLPSARWTLDIRDGAPRRVQKTLIGRQWGVHINGKFAMRGMPVPMVHREGVVYERDDALNSDVLRYGSFSMEQIVGGVLPVPEKHNPHHLVPAFPNGMYFAYALSRGNNRVLNLNLDESSDYIRIPDKEYEMVVAAYERKLKEVEAKMHDLSSMEITIEPLVDPGTWGRDGKEDSMLCLTLECYLPRVDALA